MTTPRWKLRWFLLVLSLAAMGWHTTVADAQNTATGTTRPVTATLTPSA